MDIVILIVLLVLAGLLVMSELAVVSARKVRLEQAAERGNAGARAALALANSPLKFLATIQTGITAITILCGAFAERSLADRLAPRLRAYPLIEPYAEIIALVLVVTLVTYLSLVISELVPKRIALAHAEPIACATSRPMTLLAGLASPIVALLSGSSELILRALGLAKPAQDDVSEEDVRGMIQKGTLAGVFHEAEQDLVERVFRLADLRVKALMVPRSDITWIDSTASIDRVRLIVATSPHSHFPVCEGSLDKVVGVVHVKDLVKYGMLAGDDVAVADVAAPPMFVPEAVPALKLLERFREEHRHLAIVVDEFGGVEGLVTLNDLVERVMGGVALGAAHDDAQVVRRADGSWLVDGRTPLDDLWTQLGAPNPEDEELRSVHTAAGLVVALLGRVPRKGESAERYGFRFEVVDMDARRVDQILIAPLPPSPHPEDEGE